MQNTKSNLRFLFGCSLTPLMMLITFYGTDPGVINYTHMLNNPAQALRAVLAGIPAFVYIFLSMVKIGCRMYPKKSWMTHCIVFAVIVLCAVLFPYHEPVDFPSAMHIICTMLSVADLQLLLYRIGWQNIKVRDLYFLTVSAGWLISLAYNSVNGWAEIIYASMTSIAITILNKETREKAIA
jgi:hypothetical protein